MSATDPLRAVPIVWLVRLRWFFLAGQLIAVIALATWGYSRMLAWAPLCLALVVYAGSNLVLSAISRRPLPTSPAGVMGAVLVLDTGLLTVVLAASGGASNPFTVLYLVHITLSAVALSAAWTAAIAVLAVGGFGTLFLLTPTPMTGMHDAAQPGFGQHLQGMWAAFVLATALTAFFVGRISRLLASQHEQIARLRELSARNARLAALTTLAAGAAHELNSPLGTIALAAHEAERHSKDLSGAESIADDLRLIKLEVDRCQDILHRMAARASESEPANKVVTMNELALLIADHLGEQQGERVELRTGSARPTTVLPSPQVAQSVLALIRNALDASDAEQDVVVEVASDGTEVLIEVSDRGTGIASDVLDKVGEPFFTTKQPGEGLGLGVFLARSVIESRGGTLSVESTPGKGTRAVVRLPVGETAETAA